MRKFLMILVLGLFGATMLPAEPASAITTRIIVIRHRRLHHWHHHRHPHHHHHVK
ncbi:MAG TPA: hypothetical protein VGG44_07420 [Tepidisphaeraceae bacterium]